jgi:membrane-bound metal-dependent hydrolase YbcI (DUF457 family)
MGGRGVSDPLHLKKNPLCSSTGHREFFHSLIALLHLGTLAGRLLVAESTALFARTSAEIEKTP